MVDQPIRQDSTIRRWINGLESSDEGRIFVEEHLVDLNARDIDSMRRRYRWRFSVSTGSRSPACSKMSPRVRPSSLTSATDNEHTSLQQIGLAQKADAYPGQLSGGQRQCGAVAQALAMKPRAILFDELPRCRVPTRPP